jgi:hypothetical protein
MRVVSNTSPISNLAIIGRLDLLKGRYGRLFIPPAVAQELAALSHPQASARIAAALTEGWLVGLRASPRRKAAGRPASWGSIPPVLPPALRPLASLRALRALCAGAHPQ